MWHSHLQCDNQNDEKYEAIWTPRGILHTAVLVSTEPFVSSWKAVPPAPSPKHQIPIHGLALNPVAMQQKYFPINGPIRVEIPSPFDSFACFPLE